MKNEKKERIINISIDLFAKYGISNVSVSKIGETLGASKGMVYYYFKNGKSGIVSEILYGYEQYIVSCIPDKSEWISPDVSAEDVLFKLFFNFPEGEMLKLRKIVRIIMSEMYHNKQIAEYAKRFLINEREELLADCFTTLADNKKIDPLDSDSIARFLNRLLLVYAMEDALLYPYVDKADISKIQNKKTFHDCTNLMNYILSPRK